MMKKVLMKIGEEILITAILFIAFVTVIPAIYLGVKSSYLQ